MRRWCCRCGRSSSKNCGWGVFDVEAISGYDGLEVGKEGRGVLFCPEVDVQTIHLVQEFLLVSCIVAGDVPLALISIVNVDCQSEEGGLLVRVGYTRCIQVAREGILVRRAGMVGDLKFGGISGWVMVDVDIAPPTETTVWRFRRWEGESVVDVCEAGSNVSLSYCMIRSCEGCWLTEWSRAALQVLLASRFHSRIATLSTAVYHVRV